MLEELKILANGLDAAGIYSGANKVDLLLRAIVGDNQRKIDGDIEVAISQLHNRLSKKELTLIADEISDLLMLHSDTQKFLGSNSLHEKKGMYRVNKPNGLPMTKYHNSPESAVADLIIRQSSR